MGMNKGNGYAVTFRSREHEMFCRDCLPKCRQQDVYHKALVYCLWISGDTRRNIGRIFDFKEDSVKPKCLDEGWVTSGSARVVRIAFNLFCNGTPSVYDLKGKAKIEECRRYTVEDLFCCEYAVYFWEAVKVRYPEYCSPAGLPVPGA